MIAQQPPLQWIRPPRQARTQQSLERLLDAAEVLLRDKSFDDIHVSEIALRAELRSPVSTDVFMTRTRFSMRSINGFPMRLSPPPTTYSRTNVGRVRGFGKFLKKSFPS